MITGGDVMKKLFCLFFILIMLLSGCIRYDEHIYINQDGSGRVIFKMGFADETGMFEGGFKEITAEIERESKEALKASRGIIFVDSKSYVNAGVEWSEFVLEFESLEELVHALEYDIAFSPGGMGFIKESDHFFYRRTLPPSDFASSDDFGLGFDEYIPLDILGPYLADTYWGYTVTFPGHILETDVLGDEVNQEFNTVHWSIEVMDLLTNGKDMWAKIAL